MIRRLFLVASAILVAVSATYANFSIFQAASNLSVTCSASLVDGLPASPGSYTWGASFRKIRVAYAGSLIQLQSNESGNPTQDIGTGTGCDLATATADTFCGPGSLAATTTSSRITVPTGATRVYVYNSDQANKVFYVLGNSSVVATTSSTLLGPQEGDWATVGASTHVAAIVGVGAAGAGSTAAVKTTKCGVSILYDQIGSLNATQSTQANQLAYFSDISTGSTPGKPGMIGCGHGVSCFMDVADNAVYKTVNVHMFAVATVGRPQVDETDGAQYRMIVGYPNDSASDAQDFRWNLNFGGFPDLVIPVTNLTINDNTQGVGEVWRAFTNVWDFSTSDKRVYVDNVAVMNGTDPGSITYPNAVGLRIAGDRAGHGAYDTVINEILIASATQTGRSSVVSNMMAFWGTTVPPPTTSDAEGFAYAPRYFGTDDALASGGCYTINGNTTCDHGAFMAYSFWRATNVNTSTRTSLGDMYRFQIKQNDENWLGLSGYRQEIYFNNLVSNTTNTYQLVWTARVTPVLYATGATFDWNVFGQCHFTDNGTTNVATAFDFRLQENAANWQLFVNGALIGTIATATDNQWEQFFVEYHFGTAGAGADSLKVWFNGSSVYNQTGNLWPAGLTGRGDTSGCYMKFGNYRGNAFGIPETGTSYFANMQFSNKAVVDLTSQIATPKDSPMPYLLKRDLDPAANDNTPMWLNQAA